MAPLSVAINAVWPYLPTCNSRSSSRNLLEVTSVKLVILPYLALFKLKELKVFVLSHCNEQNILIINFLDFQPNSAYVAFTKVYKPKFTYFKRTIESFANYVGPIKKAIYDLLFATLFGQVEPLPDELCDLLTYTLTQGELIKPDLRVEALQ